MIEEDEGRENLECEHTSERLLPQGDNSSDGEKGTLDAER